MPHKFGLQGEAEIQSVHISQSSFFNLSHPNICMRILHSTQVSMENTRHKLQWLSLMNSYSYFNLIQSKNSNEWAMFCAYNLQYWQAVLLFRATLTSSAINIVHGGWSSWESWERCSLTCGGGSQSRVRSCTNPPPQWDGNGCHGHSSMNQSCNTNHCPGESV